MPTHSEPSMAYRPLPSGVMQRRHFETVAQAIRNMPICADQKMRFATMMAEQLRGTNPHFRADFFISACTGTEIENPGRSRPRVYRNRSI